MNFTNKKVLVVGTGISGIAAVKLLSVRYAEIILYDENTKVTEDKIRERLPEGDHVDIYIGILPEKVIEKLDIAIISPGVPVESDLVCRLKETGIPIWGEIELAYVMDRGMVVAITGTNGKTTTTSLTGEIMKSFYSYVFVVGNIGLPYTEAVEKTSEHSVTVAEISSFQLETVHSFRPQVSAILNVTPDHLDRHFTMDHYAFIKKQIAINQTQEEVCVLNYEDKILRSMAKEIKANIVYFSSKTVLKEGIYLDDAGNIIVSSFHKKTVICNISELQVLGIHSYENVMAAIGISMAMDVPLVCIQETVKRFQAIEHRIEYVAVKNGVKYYNDSKGTNPDAAIKGIQAMVSPTWLIGGGYDKNSEFDEWIGAFDGKVKKLVLLGETKEKIAVTAKKYGFNDVVFVENLEDAVDYCSTNAESGDAVLLSPACASWDMFSSYEERGNHFKEYVNRIETV